MKNLVRQLRQRAVDLKPDELRAVGLAFVCTFIGAGPRIMRTA